MTSLRRLLPILVLSTAALAQNQRAADQRVGEPPVDGFVRRGTDSIALTIPGLRPGPTAIEIKDIDLNETMVRAIAKQAEAERLRRAKVINAMGEQQAAEKLVEAGRILSQEPQAMQLRYFAALHDIAGERSSTIVFPLPTDLLDHLMPRRGQQ